jgi:hypothetical protein
MGEIVTNNLKASNDFAAQGGPGALDRLPTGFL